MTFVCCVPGCRESEKRSLHSFPKNQEQCQKWIDATLTYFLDSETAWKTFHKVCRKHFEETDFRHSNLLKKGVVPSLMLPHSIVYEHDYCIKNSIIMSTVTNSTATDINAFDESAHSIELEHDYCIKNSIVVSSTEATGLNSIATDINGIGKSATMSDENCPLEVGLSSESNENELMMKQVCSVTESPYQHSERIQIISSIEICMATNTTEFEKGSDKSDLNAFGSSSAKQVNEEENRNGGVPLVFSVTAAQGSISVKPKSRVYNPLVRKMRYLQERNKLLKKKLKDAESVNFKSNQKSKVKKKIDGILKLLSSELPVAQYNFIKLQLKNAGKAKNGNRFTFDEKTLALVIYKQNPKRYNDLRKISNLPTRQTLIIHSAAIRFKEGLNQNLMNFIEQIASQMEPLERLCTLGWDEISLTSGLHFDHIKDYIDGFEDLGSKRTNNFATHGLVFMVRGVLSPYKQPISYYLTENLKATELAELIILVTTAVMDTGENRIYVK